MHRSTLSVVILLIVFLAVVGCSSSGNGTIAATVIEPQPMNVAGMWESTVLNADATTYTDCEGTTVFMESKNFSETQSKAISNCSSTDPVAGVSQDGGSFTIEPRTFVCDNGTVFSLGGGGTIDGNQLSGAYRMDYLAPIVASRLSTMQGLVTGNVIDLQESSVSWSSSSGDGSCALDPPLASSVLILRDATGPVQSSLLPVGSSSDTVFLSQI